MLSRIGPLLLGLLLSAWLSWALEPDSVLDRVVIKRRAFMAGLAATLRSAWEKFDTGDLTTLGEEAGLLARMAPRISDLFPPGSFGKGSRALPTITEEREMFRRLTLELQQAAEGLAERVKGGDPRLIWRQLLKVGSICRACHRRFVKPPS